MSATVLSAKPLLKERYEQLAVQVQKLVQKPILSVIVLGDEPASRFYVQNVEKQGTKTGIIVQVHRLPIETTQTDLLQLIKRMNLDPGVNGIMLQKPFPSHIDEDEIVMAIEPSKDVDGFHPINLGNIMLEKDGLVPCTPAAVLEMMDFYGIHPHGKHVVIIGRSNIVGKPLANLLLQKKEIGNATVTVCHSQTRNMTEITRQADILIVAIGKPEFVTGDMLKYGSIVLDVGINEVLDHEGKPHYVGDVDYNSCVEIASAITPVPGGVGSVTTYRLLRNTFQAKESQEKTK
ncbi:MAG TPA: bifunctional 5,10-methylenetetrahydrofolate dehydrogenase/5,10-methenyltetrahydrofolate cyclohydrolase [Candidatus Cloacimonadota bacterium]|nr:bifunctional 5,10-methylenetetrahydrofolate dehydrogenase/5,10-methenyltetrahydrofolate cyclohydrolase [Candidatus Cloacimonadota bacterium]HPT71321.1 bifunctional 5,10-methylenetetrahydrofolate dehydrogenase/5,10-methenyltetrahydrofolate cyclohydrolase [Candidatus Cloacimonadota bacterium]